MKVGLALTRRYYPRSFLRLLLVAFGAVALPLVLAFINAAVYLDRLADQSQIAVAKAAQAARASRLLMEQVTGLERTVRQYLVLGDAELLQDYDRLRADFKSTTSELSLLPVDEQQLRALNLVIDKEQSLFALLGKGPLKATHKSALIEGYVALSDLAKGVLEISNGLTDREIERLRGTGERAQRILWWQFSATIPIGLLIAVAVTVFVAQPIRELDQAIRRLGAGEFGGAIRVRGPADVRYLGDRLDWLRQRLVELEQQKQVFLRHVSHELKTPLTSLREGSELLFEETAGPLSARQREIVAILRNKSGELQSLIEELLGYHRAQESMGRLELAPVRMDRIVAEAAEDQQLAAQARGIRFDMRLEPVTLPADAEKLRTIADNLISNAVKHSPDGGIISLAGRREGNKVIIEVSDTGPGVPVADRERIFDWFYQGEHAHRSRVRGSGLGLAIAKEMVTAHRGRIELVDDGAGGARFRVSLPVTWTS